MYDISLGILHKGGIKQTNLVCNNYFLSVKTELVISSLLLVSIRINHVEL